MIRSTTKAQNCAQIVLETLKNVSVSCVFGYPGSAVLPLYNELAGQADIKHYLMRHEQAVVHAATGYAKLTGKTGVVLVTSGPGATNAVTGIADAYFDGVPLVVLVGQVETGLLGKNSFQEIDIVEITKTCSKCGFRIHSPEVCEETLIKAFDIAQEGRKGPVVVEIAKDVFLKNVAFQNISPAPRKLAPKLNLEKVQSLINSAKAPVIVAGAGVLHSGATKELYDFAKTISAPVVKTMQAPAAFPEEDENSFSMLGIYGENSANEVIRQSDLLIVLGARFNDRITGVFLEGDLDKKIIQVDIHAPEIGRNLKVTEGVNADIKAFLTQVQVVPHSDKWLKAAQKFKQLNEPLKRRSNLLHSVDAIKEIFKYSDIVTTDVGQHQIFAVKSCVDGVNILTSGGLGTMGFGLPAAIGAAIGAQQNVVCITGDGSFQMSLAELAVVKNYNLPVKIMIMNNGYLGMVRQLQGEKDFATRLVNPDFVKLAESYGIKALRVSKISEVEPAMKLAFQCEEPFLIDFIVEPLEEV